MNCGGLPDHLLENELFGHVRGAYTDAHTSHGGLLAVAEGGTLFLDEIDALSLPAQVKLLRFLQDREYRPLGSNTTLTANIRVVARHQYQPARSGASAALSRRISSTASTSCISPFRLCANGSTISLGLPDTFPPEDLPPQENQGKTLTMAGLRKFRIYRWPGNVRNLKE